MADEDNNWLSRIRDLVPARTMGVYTALTTLYATVWAEANKVPWWAVLVVMLICLAFQLGLGFTKDKKKPLIVICSGIAFVLYVFVQPYIGMLAVLNAGKTAEFILLVVAAAYVLLLTYFVKDFKTS